jgi:hypothetical protein
MSYCEDDLQSISVYSSSSSRQPRNNRNKTLAARADAADLRDQVVRLTAEVNDLHCQNALLTYQLCEARSGVSTLLRHIPGDQASASDPQPRFTAPAPPRRTASPPPAPVVLDFQEPPISPDSDHRRVVADLSGPPPSYAAPAPRSINERLGGFPPRSDISRGRSHRDRSSSPSERRPRPRRSSPPPPGASKPPPPRRSQDAARRGPGYPSRNQLAQGLDRPPSLPVLAPPPLRLPPAAPTSSPRPLACSMPPAQQPFTKRCADAHIVTMDPDDA